MEKNLGHATAYGYAKSKGYSGTEEEFAELMADYASVGQSAAQSASEAAASATSASGSAAAASQAAQTATDKASEAVTAAGTATTKASEASTSADTASTAAQTATDKASIATTAASTATTKASEAAASETAALSAKTDAETARDAAAQSASEAAASAESIDPDEFNRKIYAAFATDTSAGAIASFADGADSIPMKDVLVHIEPVQEGSGDPSPDNVRPITGWTGAKVTRCGKNLLNPDISAWNVGKAYRHFNNVVPKGKTARFTFIDKDTSVSISNIYIGFTADEIGNISLQTYTWVIQNGELQSNQRNSAVNGNSGALCSNVMIYPNTEEVFNALFARYYIMVELGSTATDYEPYSGQTYDITFPTEAGTVYGGTLDVTKGELVVDKAYELLDDTSKWKVSPSSSIDFECSTNAKDRKIYNNSYDGLTCSYAPVNKSDALNTARWTSSSDFAFGFRGLGLSLEQIKADAQAGKISILYDLATPITYQLTPQEITSLLGTNNIWADTGDVEVEYRADTTLYIKRLTDSDTDMVSDSNIVSGQYFMIGTDLYKATVNIASGASVIVGTNATKISLAQALNEINQ